MTAAGLGDDVAGESVDGPTVALAQIETVGADCEGNRERAVAAIERAAAAGADLVALPELWRVGYFAFDAYERAAEGIEGPLLTDLANRAAALDVGLLAGTVVEDLAASAAAGIDTPAEEGLANAAVLFDRDGERRLVYRKHHLFGYGSAESRLLVPGEAVPTAEFDGLTVGVTTCYDLRFPELYRGLADDGVDLILVPSAWPYPRVEHWETLTRARAIENLSYVAAVNGSGSFDDATLLGRSTVHDPWGTALAAAGDDPALVTATVNRDRLDAVREEFPVLDDRRA